MLPNYLIIGAQKAGTTFLHETLCTHPLVVAPKVKEVHYFDFHPQRGLRWYRRRFPVGGVGALLRARRCRCRLRRGEATPYYLFHPLAAGRIAHALPGVKLIAVLRNPIHRAYSHYQHNVRRGREPLSFADAVAAEPERLAGEEERLRNEPGYRSYAHQHYSYVARGEYARQLAFYLDRFPRESLLVLKAEDLFADPGRWVNRTCEFLGLPLLEPASNAWSPRNVGAYENLDSGIHARLAAHYAPHNERLSELLGYDLGW